MREGDSDMINEVDGFEGERLEVGVVHYPFVRLILKSAIFASQTISSLIYLNSAKAVANRIRNILDT